MKKLSYIFILLVTLPMLLVVSCGENKSDDTTAPTISDVRFNVNDTIKFVDAAKNTIILEFNDSTRSSLKSDTLIIGKSIRFRGSFIDDVGLSTAYIHIWGDSSQLDPATAEDTCFNAKKVMGVYMFGDREKIVGAMGIEIFEKGAYRMRRRGGGELKVRESGTRPKDNYEFSIRCTDMAGNEDLTSYKEHPIMILSRQTIIDAWEKDKSSFKRIQ